MGAGLSLTMPGRGAIYTNENMTEKEKIQNSVDLAPAAAEEEEPVEAAEEVEDCVYIKGYLMKLGEHLFARYDKRFFVLSTGKLAWYKTEEDYEDHPERETGCMKTSEIIDARNFQSHSGEKLAKGDLRLILPHEKKRELQHPDKEEGWRDIKQWLASFAAEREDRGRPSPSGNRTWSREAQTHKKQKVAAAARKTADAEAWARATNKATEDTQVYKQKKEEKKVLVETGTAIERVGADILEKRQAEVLRESRRRLEESNSKSPSHSQSQEARATPSPSVTSVTSDLQLTTSAVPFSQSLGPDDADDDRVQHLSPRAPQTPTIVTNVIVKTESTEAAAASPGDANPDGNSRKGCCAACVVC